MRWAAATLAFLAAVGVTFSLARDREAPTEAEFPADRLAFAWEDWRRAPDRKLGAVAVGAVCGITSGRGDLDGDGGPDVVLTYSTDRSCRNERVAVFRSDGTAHRDMIETDVYGRIGETCPSGCSVFAVADLNGDARAEVVLELAHGASQVQLGLYRLDSDGLVRLRTVDRHGRRPATFSYYGSICCGSHVSCRGRDLVVASSYGRTTFGTLLVGETVYRFDGNRFVEIARRSYPPRATGDPRGSTVPGRACIEPTSPTNAERDLDRTVGA